MYRDFDWARAEENMLRGLAHDPSYAQGHSRFVHLLQATGRTDSALAEARRAVSLDPLSLLYNNYLGTELMYAGHPEEALRQLDRVLSIDSTFATAHANKSGAYLILGDWDAAVEEMRAFGRLPPLLVELYHAALIDRKNNAEFLTYVDQLPPQAIAALASTLGYLLSVIGENQRALDMIEMAIDGHAGHMVIAFDFPLLAPLQDEPRFQALRQAMGLE
jgi:tetratricopeptide (TPR) repeat protein